jgi:uncharacterized protein YegP (UPF0339 family)
MRFELYLDRAGDYRWRAVADNGRIVADSAEGYERLAGCRRSLELVRDELPAAPVLDETGGEHVRATGNPRLRLRLYRDRAREFRWTAIARNGKKVADSAEGYKRKASAEKTLHALKLKAKDAVLRGLFCPLYTVSPNPAVFGARLTLTKDVASPVGFGATKGAAGLVNEVLNQETTLSIASWTDLQVQLDLPAQAPFLGPYSLSLDVATQSNCRDPVVIVGKSVCVFTMSPQPGEWGGQLTLTATTPTTFGATAGQVQLAGPQGAGQAQQLTVASWSTSQIKVTLPAQPPFQAASYRLLVTSTEVEGEAPVVIVQPATAIAAALKALADKVTLNPVGPVTLPPGTSQAATLKDLPSSTPQGTLTLPGNVSIPMTVSVTWAVADGAGSGLNSDLYKRTDAPQPLDAAATYEFVPPVVTAPAGSASSWSRQLKATVKLEAQGVTHTRELALAIALDPLPVPVVVALFNHAQFDLGTHGGIPPCALVLVPTSGISTSAITGALQTLQSALGALKLPFPQLPGLGDAGIAEAAVAMLVTTLNSLAQNATSGTGKSPKLLFQVKDSDTDFSQTVFYTEVLYTHTAEDTFGSLLMVGLPGASARFYNDRNFNVGAGAFNLVIPSGRIAAVVDTLHANPPSCDPSNAVLPHFPPSSGSFGDRLSAFQFLPPPPWS